MSRLTIFACVALICAAIPGLCLAQFQSATGASLEGGELCTNGDRAYATSGGTVLMSIDHGATWVPVHTESAFILSLACYRSYVFAAYASGTKYSSDAGVHWSNCALGRSIDVKGLGDTLIARSDSEILISSDQGVSWVKHSDGLPSGQVYDLTLMGSSIWVSTPSGLYSLVSVSSAWQETGIKWSFGLLRWDRSTIWAAASSGIYFSLDSGRKWVQTSVNSSPGSFEVYNGILFSGVGVYNGMVYASYDSGRAWDTIARMHRVHAILVSPPNLLVSSTNTGFYYEPLPSFGDVSSIISKWNQPHSGQAEVVGHSMCVLCDNREETELQFFDVIGNLCVSQRLSLGENTIDMSHLPPGVYFAMLGARSWRVLKK